MPAGSGRKVAAEWCEVTKIDGISSKVKCKHCNMEISSKIERIRSHIQKCEKKNASLENEPNLESEVQVTDLQLSHKDAKRKCDSEIEITLCDPSSSCCSSRSDSININSFSSPSESDNSLSQRKKSKQTSLNEFAIKTTQAQKYYLDKKIAICFFANNIAFNVADSKQYRDMVSSLRPGYEGPNAAKIGGALLNECANDVDEKLKNEVKYGSLTIIQDGWSSVCNDPIIATSIHTGSKSFLLNAIDCGAEKKTAEFCADTAEASIKLCEEKLGKKVFAVCSDNENKMKKMKEILKERFPNLLTYGCNAHYMNLVEKQVTPRTVIKHIVEVNKYFRNVHQAHGWLREKSGLMPQIPNDTRWNSQHDCVRTYVSNYHLYVEIRTEKAEDFDNDISRILDNVGIYREAINLLKQLTEVSKYLDQLQSDSATLSDAVDIWLNACENKELEPYKEEFEIRFSQAMEPFHFLANLMDPRHKGRRLHSKHEKDAEMWVKNHHPEFLPGILAFSIEDEDYYPKSMFYNDVIKNFSPAKWWKIIGKKTEKSEKLPVGFCDFFWALHCTPASSASIERVFSTYGLVWSKLRNRIGVDKAQKLVKVHRFLRS